MRVLAILAGVIFGAVPLSPAASAAAEEVPLVLYNDYSPLVTDRDAGKGLAYDVADLLSKRSSGKYHFSVQVVPRKRLDDMLASGQALVAPFVAPVFFGDAAMTRYLWTAPLFNDRQEIVFNPAKPAPYETAASLNGKVVGGILGQLYQPLEDDIKAGRITREDVRGDDSNLAKLAAGRIDVVAISSLSFNFLRRADARFAALQPSPKPLYPIERRFLVQGRADIKTFLDGAVAENSAADWKAVFTAYGIQ